MGRGRRGLFVVAVVMICAAAILAPETAGAQEGSTRGAALAAKLHVQRESATDLEVGGDLAGLPAGTTRYITRDDLLALPQVSYATTDDGNFTGPAKLSGVLLEDLLRDLSAAPQSAMVIAICHDRYRTNYPGDYLEHHNPVLVLEVNGEPPSGWPKDAGGYGFDMGPYMISHAKFTPAFKILSHVDEAQIPWGVVRLEFREEQTVFGAIAPRGPHANEPAVQDGYKIAEQNCFRCHNSGAEGGQKSGVPWTVLTALAAGSPQFFAEYVRRPEAKNPKTQMERNPEYDDETMSVLIAYFRTFLNSQASAP